MKVNFNCPFTNYKGEPIVQNDKEQLMKDVISPILFDGEWISKRNTPPNGDEKIRAYELSLKIYQSSGEIEISLEDAVLIKDAVQVLNAGGYAQVVKLIDG